jgi:hypothetical protein
MPFLRDIIGDHYSPELAPLIISTILSPSWPLGSPWFPRYPDEVMANIDLVVSIRTASRVPSSAAAFTNAWNVFNEFAL